MKIFGWDLPNITFTWVPGLSKGDPIIPYQFDGAIRRPKTHWAEYALVALVLGLVLLTLFLIGLDLSDPIPR